MGHVPTSLSCMVFCFYFWLHEWTPSPSIQSFSLISSSNLVHMVHLTTSASDSLPCLHWASPGQWRPPVSPTSAAAVMGLDAILRHFWKEAGIRVPRSLSVYTHSERAVTEWMRGESGGERECGFSALHPCVPQHSHSYASILLFFHGPLNSLFPSVQHVLIKASTAITSGQPAYSGFCSGKQDRSAASVLSVALSEQAGDNEKARLYHSVLLLLPCLTLCWNARSELCHLRIVDVHSGKERRGMNWVGGDETARGSHVACFASVKRWTNVWDSGQWAFSETCHISMFSYISSLFISE